jgi:hypothetical protein
VFRLSKWTDLCETILTGIGLPYDFEQMLIDAAQLPDTFIVYFLVDDTGITHAEGKETSHEARVQISLFYRDNSMFLTVPDQIETAFMAAGFTRVGSGRIPFQNDTRHHGWRCDFCYYERR